MDTDISVLDKAEKKNTSLGKAMSVMWLEKGKRKLIKVKLPNDEAMYRKKELEEYQLQIKESELSLKIKQAMLKKLHY